MGKQLLTSGIMALAAVAGAPHIAGFGTAEVLAAAQSQRAPARMRFEAMDQNRDGAITRDEWRGSARSFQVHDWNGDGRLSGDEVRVDRFRGDDIEAADHDPSRAEQFVAWTERGFVRLDHDRNRRITSNEWHYDREMFLRADRNRDGALDTTEFIGADMDDDRGDRFDDLDQDRDGRVERREWHASDDAFTWLDRNRDGLLSRTEVVGENAAPAATRDVTTVTVDARQRWTDTGIDVRQGDVLSLVSRGSIQMSSDRNDTAAPAGSRTGRGAQQAPVQAVAGALIARVAGGAPFLIGDRSTITAPASGRLQLGVNDDYLDDNQGVFDVRISVQPGRSSRR